MITLPQLAAIVRQHGVPCHISGGFLMVPGELSSSVLYPSLYSVMRWLGY